MMNMSDSDDERPSSSKPGSDFSSDDDDDEAPSTSWGLKRRNKRPVISDSENEEDGIDEGIKGGAESCDSDSSGSSPGAETCAICLGRMKGEVGSPDACEHTFCSFCLLEWARNNPTCPQDRIPFTLVLVRKTLGGPIDKEVPIQKEVEVEVIDLTTENPTYCEVCNECDREERLLLCDGCDLGYHLECLDPPLSQVPIAEWFCPVCAAANVPQALSTRREASTSRGNQESRGSSRSSRPSRQGQEPRRIPRTRAAERIRARIQKKKKLKRKRQKENKKAKIASGELEDKRPAIPHLTQLKHFVEEDNDVDAAHAEDKYAEQLLAGATHEAPRQPDKRRADAARLLRHVAFVPQASYSGRVKNKVIQVVNTQCESNDTDLLSGILENQAIAFSSRKKLVLTNERKLSKQPGTQVPSNILKEENSIMSEPLPSQRKTPERSDATESPSSTEKARTDPLEERINDDNTPTNRNSHNPHSEDQKRSPSKSAYQHSSNYKNEWRKEYPYRGHNRDDDHRSRRPGEHSRDSHHYRRHDEHYSSKFSSHSRGYSSWKYRNSHESSSSSYSNNDREKTSSNRNKEKDHKEQSERYERSTEHRYSSSDERYGKHRSRDRSPSNTNKSAERDRSRDYRSHSSRSHKSHSKFKGHSSHSSSTGERSIRSQWSFSYFNNDNFMTKGNNNHNNPASSSNSQNANIVDVKVSENESKVSKSGSEEAESVANMASPNGASSSIDETESIGTCRSVANADKFIQLKALIESHLKKQTVSEASETSRYPSHVMQDDSSEFDTQGQSSYASDNLTVTNAESKSTDKWLAKSSVGKKTKMSALFGDLEDDEKECPGKIREDSIEKDRENKKDMDDDDEKEELIKWKKVDNEKDRKNEKEERNKKSGKTAKKSKSKHLFGGDSDDDLAEDATQMKSEFSGSKNDQSLPKKACDKIQSDSKKDSKCFSKSGEENFEKIAKNADASVKNSHDIKKVFSKEEITDGTKSHKGHNVENSRNMTMEDSNKNGRVETKQEHEIPGLCNGKNEVTQKSHSTSELKSHVNSKQAKYKEVASGKKSKEDSDLVQSKHKGKEKQNYKEEKKSKSNSSFGELFGDIDDIESSSNSNFTLMESKGNEDSDHLAKKVEERPTTFEGKVDQRKNIQGEQQEAECSKNSNWMLDARNAQQDHSEIRSEELGKLGGYLALNDMRKSGNKQDNSRIKQQKVLLESKVVQEVKKSLDPYYRNKSITKDEYKQIVAKCVKKVVKAECGDVIEPEKMQTLVLGYIKYYKHRQMKSHT